MKIKIFRFLQYFNYLLPMKLRIKFLRLFGCNIGINTRILSNCYFETPRKITIGKNCFVNQNTKFYNGSHGEIIISDNVFIAYDCKFLAHTHEFGDANCRAGKDVYGIIKVEKGCWVGGGSTILSGVTIGKGCIIGAGSVVTKDCQPNKLYVGIPARPIKDLL